MVSNSIYFTPFRRARPQDLRMAAAFSPRVLATVLLASSLLATGGCSSLKFWDKGGEKVIEGSPEQLYRDAIKNVRNSNYPAAVERYEMLEARYPFSEQAKQGQLDLIYAYYKARASESAIDQADQFIRENPTHPRVDYAYYVRGLVYFESGANWLERQFKVDIAQRPPHEARKSFQAFQTLVQQYPKSPYAADARQRMIYLRNRLADYEVAVARFYIKRGAYVGAANRAKGVIENFDGAPAVDPALKILAASYRKLGIEDLAHGRRQRAHGNNVANVPDLPNTAVAGAGAAGATAAAGRAIGSRVGFRRGSAAGRQVGSRGRHHGFGLDRRRFRRRHDGQHQEQLRLHGGRRLQLHRPPAPGRQLPLRQQGLRRRRGRRHRRRGLSRSKAASTRCR